ncbi:MAG: sigma-70 family RNA polymerase sigma factor [Candidatus Aureabacteria bacterium]|nr:sigma-70 family RNA polymerase sigma factor [Candidatus Auribacterota bacterium]
MQCIPVNGVLEQKDEVLVKRVVEGDISAFGTLVDKYKSKIYYIAYQMTGSRSDADDIAQDTFIKAYKALGNYRGEAAFYTWLYRILMNCCMDQLRKRKRIEYKPDDLLELDVDSLERTKSAQIHSPLREAEAHELRDAVTEALESLPAKHRMVLVLHELDGMAHQDIARVVGCSEGTVRSRLYYARMKMRQKLRKFSE